MQFQHLGDGDERIRSKRKKKNCFAHYLWVLWSRPGAAVWSLMSIGMLQKLWDAIISLYLAGYKFTIR